MNLYLYIPPSSAHPPGMLKGLIFGNLCRFWNQNSFVDDYIAVASAFLRHLTAQGYSREDTVPLFLKAANKFDTEDQKQTPTSNNQQLFFHLQYHPQDIKWTNIQWAYESTCGPIIQQELGINQLTVAYSQLPNIGDKLTRTQLEEPPGQQATDYIRNT